MSEFRLPDAGEGLTEAEIVTWHVAVGDEVAVNDVLVDVETAKSIVELPSPFAGRIEELLVAEGETVAVGTPIVRIGSGDLDTPLVPRELLDQRVGADGDLDQRSGDLDTPLVPRELLDQRAGDLDQRSGDLDTPLDQRVGPAGDRVGPASPASSDRIEITEDRPKVLVGYGPSERRRRTRAPREHTRQAGSTRVLAKPPVRKLAKDLGIDLATVPCEGPTVTRADVMRHTENRSPAGGVPATPLTGVRRATAEAMIASAAVPQATEWVTVDVTATVDLVERLRADRRFEGVKVTPTLVAAKAVCLALRRTPDLHATWAGDAIGHPEHVGLGIAAATERGLVVPVVAQAEALALPDLGRAIDELVATAREGRLQPAQQSGGTFTLTNVGVFGVDGGTPILPPGQSGILALGQVARRPWVVGDEVVPRWVTTLAVTFDHRVTDGEQASRFLRDVADVLQDPALALAF